MPLLNRPQGFPDYTSQTGTTTVNVDVPGAITFTGQDLPIILDVPHAPTTFPLVMKPIGRPHRGPPVLQQQVFQWPLVTTVNVDTGGAITFTGQNLAMQQTQAVTNGAVTFTGQALPLIFTQVVVAGAITFAGGDLPIIVDVPRQAAVFPRRQPFLMAISSRGPPVLRRQRFESYAATTATTTVNVDTPGAMTFTGQALPLTFTQSVTSGAITFTGQTLAPTLSVPVTNGAITFTGQTLAPTQSQPVAAGAITFTGQALGLTFTQQVQAGAVLFTGQALPLIITQPAAPAVMPFLRRLKLRAFGPPILNRQRFDAPSTALTTITVTAGQLTLTGQALTTRTFAAIAKEGLWKPVVAAGASLSLPSKNTVWRDTTPKNAAWSPYVAKKAQWQPRENAQGQVP